MLWRVLANPCLCNILNRIWEQLNREESKLVSAEKKNDNECLFLVV